MTVKKNQNALRDAVIASGNVRPTSSQPSAIKHVDMQASRNAAIAARRAEMNVRPSVREKKHGA